MQNVISTWNGLDLRRRAVVIGATIAVFVAILALARLSGGQNMVLLYAGLDGRAAGEVVSALDQRAVNYEVRGDSIYVDAAARDALRMALAGEGLPATGGAGYEILDSLSGFGTTSQMFDAAYWRAKEGELARTVLSVPEVRAARVHISQGPSDPFRRSERPTASVTVTTASGRLPEDQARALRHLVASAVAGMRPEDVQVIDTVGGLIAGEAEAGAASGSAASAKAEEIRRSVERLLAARVGPGGAVVEVAVELITESEQITERVFDPQGRVAISTETQETSRQDRGSGGDVTVASNLPDGDAAGGGQGSSQSTESRERVNFEVSESSRAVTKAPGGIRRLTVAVLVDGQITTAPDGSVTRIPRPEEELSALRELVASATGLDEARGDVLVLKSMEFEPLAVAGTEAATPGLLGGMSGLDMMTLIQIGALALVALVLGLFVLRPILASGGAALPPPEPPLALPPHAPLAKALTGEIDDDILPNELPVADYTRHAAFVGEDPATRLRRLIDERQEESLEILRGWLEPEEERA
ncbi:flagellar basal-body MS-ring/collar protein FliF [Pseudogemmobacter sonorensis]|uniref:flagellar basal-body MS-ring/collar protein FliF n=1 Tax=Pseudogemmobacter sonorensis TaxID=2989681 RepID=UPI003694DE9F